MSSKTLSVSALLILGTATLSCAHSQAQSASDSADAGPDDAAIGDASAGLLSDGSSDEIVGSVTGRVLAPNGQVPIPISGALVYLTATPPESVPRTNHCDTCVHLEPGAEYTLSRSDGTFELPIHRSGNPYLVVQKGGFRRVRSLALVAGKNTVSPDATRLPSYSDPTSGDTIPSMLVLDARWDKISSALTKLGIQQFTLYSGDWRDVLSDATALANYQIVFLPCDPPRAYASDPLIKKNLSDFVEKGGRVYITDDSSDFLTQTWPPYVVMTGQSSMPGTAFLDEESRPATVQDPGLVAWLKAQHADTTFATINWSRIYSVNRVATTNLDGGALDVVPKVWVTSTGIGGTLPATVSFPRACGKVMFGTYHTEDVDTQALQPQDLVLFYVLLEVSVCTASDTGVLVK